MHDVGLEKLDPVADRHFQDFFRSQVGQFHAGAVDRFQFLLLMNFIGHVAEGDNQMAGRPQTTQQIGRLAGRGNLHLEIAVVPAPQRGARPLAGRQCHVERTEVRPQNLRVVECRVKTAPDHAVATAPLADPTVLPDDPVIAIQQGNPERKALEDLLILQEPGDLESRLEVPGSDENAVEMLMGQQAHGPRWIRRNNHVARLGSGPEHPLEVLAGIANQQYSWLFPHRFMPRFMPRPSPKMSPLLADYRRERRFPQPGRTMSSRADVGRWSPAFRRFVRDNSG